MFRDLPSRTSVRLPGFDYSSSNWYYVTICTKDRQQLFVGADYHPPDNMIYTPIGIIAKQFWQEIPQHYSFVTLDTFIIMPNHIHGIIILNNGRENPAPTLGQIIAYFKYQTTKEYNRVGAGFSRPCDQYNKLWQRNYYEHIIRDEGELTHIRKYILENPQNWLIDKLFISPV